MPMTDDDLLDVLRTALDQRDAAVAECEAATEAAKLARDSIRAAIDAIEAGPPLSVSGPVDVRAGKLPANVKALPAAKAEPTPVRAKNRAPVRRAPRPIPNYESIAIVANEARVAGKPMRNALVAHFDVPRTTVNNWIAKCQKLGLLDRQADTPGPAPVRPAPSADDEPAFTIHDARAALAGVR